MSALELIVAGFVVAGLIVFVGTGIEAVMRRGGVGGPR